MTRRIFLSAALAAILLAPGPQVVPAAEGESLNMLFIGNSYTGRHNLSEVVKEMLEAGDPNLTVDVTTVIYGGRTLEHHWRFKTQNFVNLASLTVDQERAAIRDLETLASQETEPSHATRALGRHRELLKTLDQPHEKWDLVVLQSYRDDLQGDESSYMEYAPKFAELIQAQGGRAVLYVTTPTTQNAEPLTETPDPAPIVAKAKSVAKLAQATDAIVVPMSVVALRCQTERPDLPLRFVNDAHLNQNLAYLTACTFYGAITGRSPEGLPVDRITDIRWLSNDQKHLDRDGKPITRIFSDKDRADLQRIAWEGLGDYRKIAAEVAP